MEIEHILGTKILFTKMKNLHGLMEIDHFRNKIKAAPFCS